MANIVQIGIALHVYYVVKSFLNRFFQCVKGVLFVFLFIASHAVGQGAVIWVFIAEIFPNNVRAKGQSLGCGTHWVFAAFITLLMPYVLSVFEGHTIFAFFAFMMVLQLLFVIFLMPETKGRTLESLAEDLSKYSPSR